MNNPNTAQASSRTPWHVDPSRGPGYSLDIDDEDGRGVAVVYGTDAEAEANAAFIVRACNSHEKLLAAAKEALMILSELLCDLEDDRGEADCVRRLEEAINEGEPR